MHILSLTGLDDPILFLLIFGGVVLSQGVCLVGPHQYATNVSYSMHHRRKPQ